MLDWILTPRNIEWLLRAVAVATPAIAALSLVIPAGRRAARAGRPAFWIAAGSGPLALVLWKVYNATMDRLGLDSIAALGLNAAIFIAVGLGLGLWLRAAGADDAG